MSLFILVRMQSQFRVWIIQSPYSNCLNWPVLPDYLFVLGDYSSPLICAEDLNRLLRSTCMKRNTGGFFNFFLKVIHLKSLPESMDPFALNLVKEQGLPWGLGLVSLPQGLEMVTVFWQSALWRARFRLPVLVFKAVFRSHSPQAWNWYLHSAKGKVGQRETFERSYYSAMKINTL